MSRCLRNCGIKFRGQKSLGPLKMSLEMAHKVILPLKKKYIKKFLKQRDIGISMYQSAVVYCCCVFLSVVGCSCLLLCVVASLELVMSNQRFLKIVCFRFPTNVPLKIEYIRF
jgi:hypothetical protein